MTDKINTAYSSYVHISNSGFEFKVEVEIGKDGYAAQFLTTSLHAFGLPHETKLWLDENNLDALEYVLKKAREQREAIPELRNRSWDNTRKAVPPYTYEETFSGETASDSPEEQVVS